MIALLRSTDGQPDSRFEKYTQFLVHSAIPHLTICWDRFGVKTDSKNNLYYRKSAKYGDRFKNIGGLLGFNLYILKHLIRRRKEYQIIHAADFDTILPALIMKLLFKKKVIYDIYDWYIDSRSINNKFLSYIISKIEYLNVTKSDIVIICEEGRRKQILYNPKKLWILPNIPYFDIQQNRNSLHDGLIINYVGILGEGRGLQNLIKLAENHPEIHITVGGFGPLENLFRKAAELPNVDFKGRVDYKEALKIMSSSNLIYAMYERVNPNHILAAPNKYYEGLCLGRPIITTVGTLVGEKVEEYDTGYCIEEDYEALEVLIQNIDLEDIRIKSLNSLKLWEGRYRDYVSTFMNSVYLKYIIENNLKN